VGWVLSRRYHQGLVSLGLGRADLRRNVLLGIGAGVVLVIIDSALCRLFMLVCSWDPTPIYLRTRTAGELAAVLLAVALLVPVAEEVLWRGFAYRAFRQRYSRLAAAACTSAIFAAFHFNLVGFPSLFVIGMGLVLLYERTGSLVTPISAHATINSMIVLMLRYGGSPH
jgi:membrane protease YdiL (CAAX protease family)